jgi:PIN domain nuclease of toxin-antitoxin system
VTAARPTDSAYWRATRDPRRRDALLLDTHAWVWTLDGRRDAMSAQAVTLIEAAARDGRLYVSDISYWEVSLKAAKGRLAFNIDPTLWLSRAADAPGIRGLPLSRGVLIQSTLLDDTLHGDPADRILIAQAQLSGLALLTCDQRIVTFAKSHRGIPVCDARRRGAA